MKIDIYDRYRDSKVLITTLSDEPDVPSKGQYEGEKSQVSLIKRLLRYGIYGHIIDPEYASNLDLQAAAIKLDKERFIISSVPILFAPASGEDKQT